MKIDIALIIYMCSNIAVAGAFYGTTNTKIKWINEKLTNLSVKQEIIHNKINKMEKKHVKYLDSKGN